jgi:activator of HSP90 ATPase
MIEQKVTFQASPERIYQALLDSELHTQFTGATAVIDASKNGRFKVWDGYAEGTITELVPNSKIVQRWRAADWPEDVWSTVTITLSERDNKTELIFTHEGVPDEFADDIAQGWHDFYWQPLKKWLSTN